MCSGYRRKYDILSPIINILITTTFGTPGVSDFIKDRPGNVFFTRLGEGYGTETKKDSKGPLSYI